MSDYEGHPAVKALLAKKRPEPKDGQAICPECDGFGMVCTPGYVQTCPRCLGDGTLYVCKHCGEAPKQQYRRCECEAAAELLSAEAESYMRCRWEANDPVPFALPCFSDRTGSMHHDGEHLADAWAESRGWPDKLPPIDPEWALLYVCEPVHARFGAEDLLEGWSSDVGCGDWDPRDELAAGAEAALQEALDAWTAEWGMDLGWVATGRSMLPPEVK